MKTEIGGGRLMLLLLSNKPSPIEQRNYLKHMRGTQILGETCFWKIILVDFQGDLQFPLSSEPLITFLICSHIPVYCGLHTPCPSVLSKDRHMIPSWPNSSVYATGQRMGPGILLWIGWEQKFLAVRIKIKPLAAGGYQEECLPESEINTQDSKAK